jgi:hypothetical protein
MQQPIFQPGDLVVQVSSDDVETRRSDGVPVVFRVTGYFDPNYPNDFMWAECESGDPVEGRDIPYTILLRPRHAWRKYA